MKEVNKYEKYYLVGADGKNHEVSEEIFREYKRSEWREEAQYKRERSVKRDDNENISDLDKKEYLRVSSLDSIIAGGGEYHVGVVDDFAESIAEAYEQKELLELLGQALEVLDKDEKDMINSLFYENISEREYERRYGVKRKTVAYRKGKVISKLKKFIQNRRWCIRKWLLN